MRRKDDGHQPIGACHLRLGLLDQESGFQDGLPALGNSSGRPVTADGTDESLL